MTSGESFPDGLCAPGLAGVLNWPIVATESMSLPSRTADAVQALGATKVVILGGTYAVSETVENALQTYAPIFLTDPDVGLSQEMRTVISSGGFSHALVLGGTSAVNASDEQWLDETCGKAQRLSGESRYDTSKAIAQFVIAQGGTAQGACIATGVNFPDALAGSALAGVGRSVMLLADEGATSTFDVLSDHAGEISQHYFLGGDAAVPPSVRAEAVIKAGIV